MSHSLHPSLWSEQHIHKALETPPNELRITKASTAFKHQFFLTCLARASLTLKSVIEFIGYSSLAMKNNNVIHNTI